MNINIKQSYKNGHCHMKAKTPEGNTHILWNKRSLFTIASFHQESNIGIIPYTNMPKYKASLNMI